MKIQQSDSDDTILIENQLMLNFILKLNVTQGNRAELYHLEHTVAMSKPFHNV